MDAQGSSIRNFITIQQLWVYKNTEFPFVIGEYMYRTQNATLIFSQQPSFRSFFALRNIREFGCEETSGVHVVYVISHLF
jgi:hypothetical protein